MHSSYFYETIHGFKIPEAALTDPQSLAGGFLIGRVTLGDAVAHDTRREPILPVLWMPNMIRRECRAR